MESEPRPPPQPPPPDASLEPNRTGPRGTAVGGCRSASPGGLTPDVHPEFEDGGTARELSPAGPFGRVTGHPLRCPPVPATPPHLRLPLSSPCSGPGGAGALTHARTGPGRLDEWLGRTAPETEPLRTPAAGLCAAAANQAGAAGPAPSGPLLRPPPLACGLNPPLFPLARGRSRGCPSPLVYPVFGQIQPSRPINSSSHWPTETATVNHWEPGGENVLPFGPYKTTDEPHYRCSQA
nr:sterile alpha motif domain-containing protein 1 [Oryctolagus cuniculus]